MTFVGRINTIWVNSKLLRNAFSARLAKRGVLFTLEDLLSTAVGNVVEQIMNKVHFIVNEQAPNFQQNSWNWEGMKRHFYIEDHIFIYSCNHVPNFAILLCNEIHCNIVGVEWWVTVCKLARTKLFKIHTKVCLQFAFIIKVGWGICSRQLRVVQTKYCKVSNE